MKISELIERLQELQEEHGDVEVQAYTDSQPPTPKGMSLYKLD